MNLYPELPVLLVDDELAWLRSLSLTLERSAGINHVIQCQDSRKVMGILAEQPVSLVLLDITMPHLTGEQLIELIMENHPQTPIIVISGRNQLEIAVNCMKLGAFDYFVKSVEEERFIASIKRALAMQEMQSEILQLKSRVLKKEVGHPDVFAEIVTQDGKLESIFQYIEAIAGSTETVLVTGESGAGKDLVARAIHRLSRPDGPYVAVNVAGLDDNVFADTLFGHTKSAFTGAEKPRGGMIEQAAGGVLFMDEIGDLSQASQVKLLRLLQDGEYYPLGSDTPKRMSARIVVATNQELTQRQAKGEFRKDLYYRLRAHHIHLPPLRERRDDLPLLLDHFLDEASQALGKKKPTPPKELVTLLKTYHFPGNIRELRSMVFDAVTVHQSGKLSMDPFRNAMGEHHNLFADAPPAPATGSPEAAESEQLISFADRLPTLEEAGQLLVEEAMRRADDNQTIAARLLGISRPALNKRLSKMREQSS